jgi:hypothetical protein
MDNVTFIEMTDPISGDVTAHAIIYQVNGEYVSMHKSTYDEQQAEHFTPILPPA